MDQPSAVADAFAALTPSARSRALDLRDMVLSVAADRGLTLCETLKWGEPAYLPGRGGTTVRIGPDRDRDGCKLLVNCQTSLVEEWRSRFDGRLTFEGNRAILVPASGPLDHAAIRACIGDAFGYHDRKRAAHG